MLDFTTIKKIIKGTKFENQTYFVGGCVRDEIMGVTPKDYDIVVSLPNGGIELAEFITKATNCYVDGSNPVVYPTYGTAMFTIRTDENLKNIEFECVQTRKEQYHSDSRNPDCVFGTLEEDAYRRDLTINSLYKNLSTDKILDPTGKGLKDISDKLIRTTSMPHIIFSDDPLRMLRVIRFATRFGWDVDEETYLGIKENVERIKIISMERIRDEINKMLLSHTPSIAFDMLHETGLLETIQPLWIVSQLVGLSQNKFHFGDVWEHTLDVLDKSKPILENRLAALLHDIGKYYTRSVDENGNVHFYQHEKIGAEATKTIMFNMKYSNDTIDKVSNAIKFHMKTKDWGHDIKIKLWKIRQFQYDAKDNLELILDLIDADNRSHAKEYCLPTQVENIKSILKQMKNDGLDCSKIKLPVNGNDIMQHLKISGGQILGKIIEHLIKMYIRNPLKYKDFNTFLKEASSYYKQNKQN